MAISKNFSLAGFDGKRREAEIARFAQDDGLHLRRNFHCDYDFSGLNGRGNSAG